MIIKDPNGPYFGATSKNRAKVSGAVEPMSASTNHESGKVWSYSFFDIDPVGANDIFFYLKNDGDADLAISSAEFSCGTTAGRLYVKHVSGTPSFTSGSDLTPISMNLGKAVAPDATCKSDTDTTGLTSEGVIRYQELAVVGTIYELLIPSKIIIPKGKSIALEWVAATGTVSGALTVEELPASYDF